MRSLCRLRAGLVVLAHRNGVRSQARRQLCVFCGATVTQPFLQHVMLSCACWAADSAMTPQLQAQEAMCSAARMRNALTTCPADPAFACVARLARKIDVAASAFWRARGHGYE